MNRTKTLRRYEEAKRLIPGGTQLFSKRPELMLPDQWPAYYQKAEGCRVWDLDGNEYIDMGTMGIGTCVLGYADPDVNAAVRHVIDTGSMSTLNPPEEVDLAELLLELHPWAQMTRFARTGGEAMAVAVRIARSFSGRDVVLFSGYHGWHDWYLSANLAESDMLDGHLLPGLEPRGVTRQLKGSAIPVAFNDVAELHRHLAAQSGKVGVIVLETIRNDPPSSGFIAAIAKAQKEYGIAFVVDEITCGFRLNCGGAHLLYGIEPDIAVYAKGMSNGFPMAAIVGKAHVMQAAQGSFISSTYWTERIGPAAALATLQKMRRCDVQARLLKVGTFVQECWRSAAAATGIPVRVSGIPPLSHLEFAEKPLMYKSLFTQQMIDRGFLASTVFYASYAHDDESLRRYATAVGETFDDLRRFRASGREEEFLKGPVCHSGFKRLN